MFELGEPTADFPLQRPSSANSSASNEAIAVLRSTQHTIGKMEGELDRLRLQLQNAEEGRQCGDNCSDVEEDRHNTEDGDDDDSPMVHLL